jgi:hypothetical protein
VDAYSQLSTIYNGQKKFEDAMKMSTKANELMSAAGGSAAATGGDATSLFNQGIIMWNQGKAAEAAALSRRPPKPTRRWRRAVLPRPVPLQLRSRWPRPRTPLQEYLKLAPTGTNAAAPKACSNTIK